MTLDASAPVINWTVLRSHASAAVVAVALHAGLAWVLVGLSDDQPPMLEVAQAPTLLKTQLIQLSPPAPVVPAPAPAPVPPQVDVPLEPAPVPEPVLEPPALEQADLALKRAEREREEEAQRKREQAQLERKRKQQEELAQTRERQRQEELQAKQREEAQRQEMLAAQRAEADRQAAAAANARAQAEAEAASRQYLPIAKEAPAYPQRALDRNIEGECTVSYTVNPTGRVENPQVLDDCHPLFKSPSLAAAKRFRYQPRVVNGQAVAVRDVKNTFSYRIE
jgi:protein TonB